MYRVYSAHNVIFMLRRAAGVALLVYFVAHVLAISTALIAGPQIFSAVMANFREPAFRAIEVIVVLCTVLHAATGLHLIAAERTAIRVLKVGHAD